MFLHVKHKKLSILSIFTWFLILGKIQDGGQDGDVSGLQQRHRPYWCTSSCREDWRISTKRKIVFEILQPGAHVPAATYQKLEGGAPLYHCGGMILRVRLRFKTQSQGDNSREVCSLSHIFATAKVASMPGIVWGHGSQRRLKCYLDHRWCWLPEWSISTYYFKIQSGEKTS